MASNVSNTNVNFESEHKLNKETKTPTITAAATTTTTKFKVANTTTTTTSRSLGNQSSNLHWPPTQFYLVSYNYSHSHHRSRSLDSLAFEARPTNASKLISKLHRFVDIGLRATVLSFLIVLLSSWIALPSVALAAAASSDHSHLEHSIVPEPRADSGLTAPLLGEDLALTEIFIPITNSSSSASSPLQFLAAANISNVNGTAIGSSPYSNGIRAANTPTDFVTSVYDGLSDSPTNTSVLLSEMEAKDEFVMPPVHAIVVSIVLLFVILGTIVGNILVCIAVCMVRKLRRPCNYLLVSLALSDLCVAVLVMPMALLYEVLEKWSFGTLLCDIWVSFDVLCCTASILNLCAISVDRYLAITKPLEYGVKRTPRRMMLCVALVWLAAACISLPPLLILGNEHMDKMGVPSCQVSQNSAYQIYATLGSFYIPLSVMLFVYYQIFRAARRIVLEEKRAQTHLQHALNGTGSPPAPGQTDISGGGNGQHRHSSYGNVSLNYSTCGGLNVGSPHQKKLRFQLAKEKKASTTLGIIMSAFTICWLPFFILALIRPFVDEKAIPPSLSSLFLWLGYANSLLNPIIYATLNRDFRKPFQEILYFRCSSLNTMMRENYYQDQYGEPPSQRVMLGDDRHGARESFL